MSHLSYKQRVPTGPYDAIVVGSGPGGLSAASLLAQVCGHRVLVLERHYAVGGFTHTFTRGPFSWEVGIHYIGEMNTWLGDLFDFVTDGGVTWAPLPDRYDRFVIGEETFEFPSGRSELIESLTERFPHEARGIRRYFDTVRSSRRATVPFFTERALPAVTPRVLRRALTAPFARHARVTTRAVLGSMVDDPLLYDLLTAQWPDYGETPAQSSFAMHAALVHHYLEGAHFPVGGPATFADAVERVLQAHGGDVFTNADVQSIVCENGRVVGVRMIDGREIRAPLVVSDAGVLNTWQRLVPRALAEATGWPDRLASIRRSPAHMTLYVGLDGTVAECGLSATNYWIYPSMDREDGTARFLLDPDEPLPHVAIMSGAAKDPTHHKRNADQCTVQVATLANVAWFARWQDTRWKRRGADYVAWKEHMAERLLTYLYRHFPKTRGRVRHAELSTPLSTAHFSGHQNGEIYGLAHVPERFDLPIRAMTEVPGLVLTGQDLAVCGLVGASLGGMLAATSVALSAPRRTIRHHSARLMSNLANASERRVA